MVEVNDLNEDFILVGFYNEHDHCFSEALHFQRGYGPFSAQEISFGMNRVYIERNDQSEGGYGGINRVILRPDTVQVVVDSEMAKILGDTDFEIHLSLSPEEVERLRTGLRKVFQGFGTLTE